ncbi:MAG: hemerythrin domain-containing protein [Giesbergeria sp.]
MNLDKYKQQHVKILDSISTLRKLARAGVAANAKEIAQTIVSMSSTIKLHLAVEDQSLYPALQRSGDAELARIGEHYQQEMGGLCQAYESFAHRWNHPDGLIRDEEGFRTDANTVLRLLQERVQRENIDFYPRIETM